MISLHEFERLAQQHNVVPLERTLLADMLTPVSAYLTLRKTNTSSFLFESVEPDEKVGRFSFVGVGPSLLVRSRRDEVTLTENGVSEKLNGSIFDVLDKLTARFRCAPTATGFAGGFVGYIGYDCVKHIERLNLPEPASGAEDEAILGLFETVVRFDHRNHLIALTHNVIIDEKSPLERQYEQGKKRLETLELQIRGIAVATNSFACKAGDIISNDDQAQFENGVVQAKHHIVDGDIFQAVLSRRVQFPFSGDPFPVYRALRIINPSPYLFYVDFGETKLIGSSPEVLVRSRDGVVELLPIAGTRKRGKTEEADGALAVDLLNDEKELAEHLMLVDLGRNDLGRICEFGSVQVPVFKRVEKYSHVMHLVSEVRGMLSAGKSAVDVLKACFPAGTVSGAPKVRAMEIINELEGESRGAYAGAVGYFGFNGSMDMCIAIRTIVAQRDTLSVRTGAGIVADSNPAMEYQETINKAQALIDAIRLADSGLTMEQA